MGYECFSLSLNKIDENKEDKINYLNADILIFQNQAKL